MFRCTLIVLLLRLITAAPPQRALRDQDPVPPDFGKAPGTLLVVRSTRKPVNKTLLRVFAEYNRDPFKGLMKLFAKKLEKVREAGQ